MGFAETKGQQRAIRIIKAGFKTGRISHAYLFFGPKGVGKSMVAQVLARLLNCENPTNDSNPCDSCSSCHKALTGNHPDIIRVEPEGKAIKISQMRALQEKASYKCYEGKIKVIMIDDVQVLTVEAANSLLKVLEEPPENTVFILIAQETLGLPATILSRCQPIPFSPLAENTIGEILKGQGIETSFPLTLARGSVGKTLRLIEKFDGEQLVKNVEQLLEGLATNSYNSIFAWAEGMEKERDLLEASLDVITTIYRDRLISQATEDYGLLLGPKKTVGRLLKRAECLQALEAISSSQQLLNKNANTRLVLEVLLLNLRNIERGQNPIG